MKGTKTFVVLLWWDDKRSSSTKRQVVNSRHSSSYCLILLSPRQFKKFFLGNSVVNQNLSCGTICLYVLLNSRSKTTQNVKFSQPEFQKGLKANFHCLDVEFCEEQSSEHTGCLIWCIYIKLYELTHELGWENK